MAASARPTIEYYLSRDGRITLIDGSSTSSPQTQSVSSENASNPPVIDKKCRYLYARPIEGAHSGSIVQLQLYAFTVPPNTSPGVAWNLVTNAIDRLQKNGKGNVSLGPTQFKSEPSDYESSVPNENPRARPTKESQIQTVRLANPSNPQIQSYSFNHSLDSPICKQNNKQVLEQIKQEHLDDPSTISSPIQNDSPILNAGYITTETLESPVHLENNDEQSKQLDSLDNAISPSNDEWTNFQSNNSEKALSGIVAENDEIDEHPDLEKGGERRDEEREEAFVFHSVNDNLPQANSFIHSTDSPVDSIDNQNNNQALELIKQEHLDDSSTYSSPILNDSQQKKGNPNELVEGQGQLENNTQQLDSLDHVMSLSCSNDQRKNIQSVNSEIVLKEIEAEVSDDETEVNMDLEEEDEGGGGEGDRGEREEEFDLDQLNVNDKLSQSNSFDHLLDSPHNTKQTLEQIKQKHLDDSSTFISPNLNDSPVLNDSQIQIEGNFSAEPVEDQIQIESNTQQLNQLDLFDHVMSSSCLNVQPENIQSNWQNGRKEIEAEVSDDETEVNTDVEEENVEGGEKGDAFSLDIFNCNSPQLNPLNHSLDISSDSIEMQVNKQAPEQIKPLEDSLPHRSSIQNETKSQTKTGQDQVLLDNNTQNQDQLVSADPAMSSYSNEHHENIHKANSENDLMEISDDETELNTDWEEENEEEEASNLKSINDNSPQVNKQSTSTGRRSSSRISNKIIASFPSEWFDDTQSEKKTGSIGKKSKPNKVESGVRVNGTRRIRTLMLSCTETGCRSMYPLHEQLYRHLWRVHKLLPFKCLAIGCNVRVKERYQMKAHINDKHGSMTKWHCPECSQAFRSQRILFTHHYSMHVKGKFKCGATSDCSFVANVREDIYIHQMRKHRPTIPCTYEGCDRVLQSKHALFYHQLFHQGIRPYRCTWGKCRLDFTQRGIAVQHVRTKHFRLPATLKSQAEKNIVDRRNPNKYVKLMDNLIE